MLNYFLSPFYKIGALIAIIFAVLAAIYSKGRSDAAAKAEIKGYKETQDAIEKATTARRSVDAAPADRLRDDDGFRRD